VLLYRRNLAALLVGPANLIPFHTVEEIPNAEDLSGWPDHRLFI